MKNKALILTFAVITVIVVVFAFSLPLSDSRINNGPNITFRGTNFGNSNNSVIESEDMVATVDGRIRRNLKVDASVYNSSSTPKTNSKKVTYVSDDLSMLSNSTMPRVVISNANVSMMGRASSVGNYLTPLMTQNASHYQVMQMRGVNHSHSFEDVIKTSGHMGAATACDHELDWQTLTCKKCGAIAQISGSGSIGGLNSDSIIWETPIGDAILPLLLLCVGYLLLFRMKK